MLYIFLTIALFIIEYFFIEFGHKFYLFDNPNDRSSHTHSTLLGGGIILWVAAVIYFILYFPTQTLFFIGLTLVSIISFIDDLRKLHQGPRFFVHLAAMTMVLISASLFTLLPWYLVFVVYIFFTGILNAYNFMDGINGLTGLYSISVLGALQYVNINISQFTEPDFIWFPMIACVVFLFFNFRKKALCFAGDVGSMSIAFWIITLLIMLMIKSGSVIWILVLALYGVDSTCTILHRIRLKQNIFKAHRLHFYQVLANEQRIDHRIISALYAIGQMVVSIAVIYLWDKWDKWVLAVVILVPLILLYTLKFSLMPKRVRYGK